MTGLAKLRFRLKVRAEFQKADKQLLDITKEETKGNENNTNMDYNINIINHRHNNIMFNI